MVYARVLSAPPTDLLSSEGDIIVLGGSHGRLRPIEGLASELKHLIKRNANVSTQHIGRDYIYPTSANSPEMVYTTLYTTDVPSRKRAVDQDDVV